MLEQKRHAVTLSGVYATDTGISLGTSWLDRDLFRHAESLTLSAAANGLGGTGTTSPGYDLKAVFAKPDFYARGQTLSLSVEGLKESLTAYSRTALLTGAALSRPVTARGLISFGPSFISERVSQQGMDGTYVLLQFPINFTGARQTPAGAHARAECLPHPHPHRAGVGKTHPSSSPWLSGRVSAR